MQIECFSLNFVLVLSLSIDLQNGKIDFSAVFIGMNLSSLIFCSFLLVCSQNHHDGCIPKGKRQKLKMCCNILPSVTEKRD